MASDTKIVALYRVAEKDLKDKAGQYGVKEKPEWSTNESCLRNFRKHYKGELVVFGDRLKETKELAQEVSDRYIDITKHGNAASFSEVLDFALDNYGEDTIVYFVEDDYIHSGDVDKHLIEGLERFDYITLYDHPDKHGAIQTTVVTTESTHWMLTSSTTMTFATKISKLVYDQDDIRKWLKTSQPNDYYMWQSLTNAGRRLGSPIPGIATHTESKWLAPLTKWENYAKN
jgi:glycosyltransferase involved in cell wall biosynthesis